MEKVHHVTDVRWTQDGRSGGGAIPPSQRRAKDGGGLGTTKQLVIGWGTCGLTSLQYRLLHCIE